MTTIANALGSGSGIDTDALVKSLVAAQRENADKAITARKDSAAAKISALGQITSTLSAFSTALTGLASGGTLSAQASSSDTARVAASFTNGPVALNSSLEVKRLAAGQTIASTPIGDASAAVGQGTLTFTFGTVAASGETATGFNPAVPASSFTVTIGPNDDSLTGVARAINAAKQGITASVVTDASGSRLVLRGPTGDAKGFTVTADPALSEFAFGVGANAMALKAPAQNAQMVLDGVAVESASNSVTDLIAGVKLDLKQAGEGTTISLTSSRDTAALSDAVSAYADAYNEVQSLLVELTKAPTDDNTAGGALRTESSVRALQAKLKSLTSTKLLNDGKIPASLAEIGVKTNRDGTLTVDTVALQKAIAADPDRIEKLLTASQSSSSPLASIDSAVGKVAAGTYQVTDLVAATAGHSTYPASATAFDTPVTIDASNHTIKVQVDNRTTLDVLIPDGDYATGADLAAAIQAGVNADANMVAFGKKISVAWNGAGFDFGSATIGSTSYVAFDTIADDLKTRLGFTDPTVVNGTDAQGKIDGIAMQGIGEKLLAPADSAAVGLILHIATGATSATISVGGGVVGAMKGIYTALATGDGPLASALARITKEQEAISDDAAKIDARSTTLQTNLTKQFAAMEAAVASFKSTQDFLKQQIDAWNADN